MVASKPGLFTQDQSGTGLAVVFNYISQSENDVNRLTTGTYNGSLSSPAKPGQVLIAWGTGIGPYAAGDNAAGISHDFSTSETITAIVGGVSIPVAFAGRAGYAGEDQINFTLPANVPTGCAVTLQISVNGVLSAASDYRHRSQCQRHRLRPARLYHPAVAEPRSGRHHHLRRFCALADRGNRAFVGTEKLDSIGGSFSQITGFQLSSSGTQNVTVTTIGSCTVVHATITSTARSQQAMSTSFDAGTVTLTGPSGTNLNNQKLTETSNTYSYTIGT